MIVFISAAATERQMVVAASKNLPAGFPAAPILDIGLAFARRRSIYTALRFRLRSAPELFT